MWGYPYQSLSRAEARGSSGTMVFQVLHLWQEGTLAECLHLQGPSEDNEDWEVVEERWHRYLVNRWADWCHVFFVFFFNIYIYIIYLYTWIILDRLADAMIDDIIILNILRVDSLRNPKYELLYEGSLVVPCVSLFIGPLFVFLLFYAEIFTSIPHCGGRFDPLMCGFNIYTLW